MSDEDQAVRAVADDQGGEKFSANPVPREAVTADRDREQRSNNPVTNPGRGDGGANSNPKPVEPPRTQPPSQDGD